MPGWVGRNGRPGHSSLNMTESPNNFPRLNVEERSSDYTMNKQPCSSSKSLYVVGVLNPSVSNGRGRAAQVRPRITEASTDVVVAQ
jgi:hypothetical protein